MNKTYLKQLVNEAEYIAQTDPQNEVIYDINFDKRLAELSKNLDETIEYLDTCSEKELDWMSEVFEELSEHFKPQKLIDCVERNITRFDNPDLREELKMELKDMKFYV